MVFFGGRTRSFIDMARLSRDVLLPDDYAPCTQAGPSHRRLNAIMASLFSQQKRRQNDWHPQ